MHRPGALRFASRDTASQLFAITKKITLMMSFNSRVGNACSTVSAWLSPIQARMRRVPRNELTGTDIEHFGGQTRHPKWERAR